MRRLIPVLAIVPVLWAVSVIADDGSGEQFRARLSGDEEVPPVETNAMGIAEIRLNDDETQAEFRLTVLQGVDVTQAHIHCGERGENGPVVVFLAGLAPRGMDMNGNWIRDASFSDRHITNPACGETLAELAQAMREGRTYANVHTVANPGGEIRGQLERN